MEKTHIEEVDRRVDSATVLRPLTEALGAPQTTGGSKIRRECAACGERTTTTVE